MRTGFGVKTPKPSASSSFLEETLVPCGFPAASVHQPSIRAQTTAHDVSIRSSTIDGADRRGGASHSMSRSSQTIDHLENARTGTSALGSGPRSGRALHDGHREWMGSGRLAAPPEFLVVNLIAQHDVETHEKLAGQGDLGLGPPPSMQDAEVAAPQPSSARAASGAAWPSTHRSRALPCLVILPSRCLSADALTAGAKPT